MTDDWRRPAICSRTGLPLRWQCLGERRAGGIWSVRCPNCDTNPPLTKWSSDTISGERPDGPFDEEDPGDGSV